MEFSLVLVVIFYNVESAVIVSYFVQRPPSLPSRMYRKLLRVQELPSGLSPNHCSMDVPFSYGA
jgi:hypothetical protein